MVSYLRQKAAEVAPLASKPLPVEKSFKATHPTWSDQFTELFVSGAVAIFLEETIRLVHEGLDFMYDSMDKLGIKYFPTQSNFFLIDLNNRWSLTFLLGSSCSGIGNIDFFQCPQGFKQT